MLMAVINIMKIEKVVELPVKPEKRPLSANEDGKKA
jgi:hypothetical protein